MSYNAPQAFRYRDPHLPPNAPALAVIFQREALVNQEVTAATGVQTYDDVLIAYVSPMGQPKSSAACEIERKLPDGTIKVNAEHSFKYAEQVRLYKAGETSEAQGTPLKELVGMTPAMAQNMKALGIHTLEMLADCPDSAAQNLMGFWDYRDRARKHIEARTKDAPIKKIEMELQKERDRADDLQRQFDDLKAAMEKNGISTAKGRKPKAAPPPTQQAA